MIWVIDDIETRYEDLERGHQNKGVLARPNVKLNADFAAYNILLNSSYPLLVSRADLGLLWLGASGSAYASQNAAANSAAGCWPARSQSRALRPKWDIACG
jgi:hypothetical protein